MMKRIGPALNFKSILFLVLTGLLLHLALLTGSARAADRSFTIKQIVVEAQALPDASMQVTEKLTVDFSGHWNGFYINIPRSNTPIDKVAVYENGRPYTFNPGTKYGDPGTYLVKNENNNTVIDWSIDVDNQTRSFDVSYRVVNAVKIHNDVAELYRKFIGSENSNKIAAVTVNLKLPAGAEGYKQGQDIRIWGHGPLNGEVNFNAPNMVTWQVKSLPAYTFLEGRVVLPAALFPAAPVEAHTGKTALAGILAEEEGWARDANQQRFMARVEMAGVVGTIILALVSVFLLWRRYGRPHATSFEGTYYRELPAAYSPAELSLLWNFKKLQAHDLTATILDLARRKFLRIDEEKTEVRKLLGSKEVKTYRLTFLEAPEPAKLRKPEEAALRVHEQELLEYLQQNIALGRGFLYLHEIEQYARKNGEDFYGFWQEWSGGLISRGEKLDFFDHSGNMPVITLLAGLGIFILGCALAPKTGLPGAAIAAAGAIIGGVPRRFKRRSVSGQEDLVRWQAFRRFLLHFSQMERHEIPSLIIWEYYLVYAVTLGVAREVMKQLEIVFPNMQDGDYRFGYGWFTYGAWTGFESWNNSFSDIGNAFEHSLKTAQAAVSKSSSGSGDGGGFSSGGGDGGGGSSYGGR